MANPVKRLWNYIKKRANHGSQKEQRSSISPSVLAFALWLHPVMAKRHPQYQVAFYVVFGGEPLPIRCMQCNLNGIYYHRVSKIRPKLVFKGVDGGPPGLGHSDARFATADGDRILLGKCSNCGFTGRLHIPAIAAVLEKRMAMTGMLDYPPGIADRDGPLKILGP